MFLTVKWAHQSRPPRGLPHHPKGAPQERSRRGAWAVVSAPESACGHHDRRVALCGSRQAFRGQRASRGAFPGWAESKSVFTGHCPCAGHCLDGTSSNPVRQGLRLSPLWSPRRQAQEVKDCARASAGKWTELETHAKRGERLPEPEAGCALSEVWVLTTVRGAERQTLMGSDEGDEGGREGHGRQRKWTELPVSL